MREEAVARGQRAAQLAILSKNHTANVKRARRSMLAGSQSRDQELAAARVYKSEGTV
jgi:hypothetical protein